MAPEAVVARVFGLPRAAVTDASSNANISAWDSLKHVTLILELEGAYGISFSAEETLSMVDVAAIKRVLKSHDVDWDGV
jgi:acyl carrier protein